MSEKKEHFQLSFFDEKELISKINSSTNLVEDLRLSPFIPKMRITKSSTFYKKFMADGQKFRRQTSFGYLEIRNRILTQTHKDIFTAIACIGVENKSKRIVNNRVVINFTMYELCRKLDLKLGGKTYKDLLNSITEIKDVTIIRDSNSVKKMYSIIESVGVIGKQGGNDLFGIQFSQEYSLKLVTDLSLNISEKFSKMLMIEGTGAGLIKSIIDHFLSHKASSDCPSRTRLEDLLITINSMDTKSKSKMFIKNYSATLEEFGIFFDEKSEIFSYNGCENITFQKKLTPKIQN